MLITFHYVRWETVQLDGLTTYAIISREIVLTHTSSHCLYDKS